MPDLEPPSEKSGYRPVYILNVYVYVYSYIAIPTHLVPIYLKTYTKQLLSYRGDLVM